MVIILPPAGFIAAINNKEKRMKTFTNQEGLLVIPDPGVVGQGVSLEVGDESYLISHASSFSVSADALPGGKYSICFDAVETTEQGHFPNPMATFNCLRISKISLSKKKLDKIK